MAKQQSRALELADRAIAYIEAVEPESRRRLTFGRVLNSLLKEDRLNLDNYAFRDLLKEVERKAMRHKDKRPLLFPLLPDFIRARYERAAARAPRRTQETLPGFKLHMPTYRPQVDPHPERGYLYEDNDGYLHNPETNFLQEAPER